WLSTALKGTDVARSSVRSWRASLIRGRAECIVTRINGLARGLAVRVRLPRPGAERVRLRRATVVTQRCQVRRHEGQVTGIEKAATAVVVEVVTIRLQTRRAQVSSTILSPRGV